MAQGNEIIVSAERKGHREEVIVSGTPKPGCIMEVVPATASSRGIFTYRATTRTTGAKGGCPILLPNHLLGKTVGDAYVSGEQGFIYWPVAGEEFNLRVTDVAGTADDVAIGDLFGVETTTGQLKANSSYTSAPFAALEAVTDPTADYLLWVKYLGNNA